MIKEISENEFEPLLDLMAEVECGNHFDANNPNHILWLKKRISIHYYRGTRFFAMFDEADTPIGFHGVLIEEGAEGVNCQAQKCELVAIGIFKEFRRKGSGSILLKHAEDFSREAGVYCMFMSTYAAAYDVIAYYGKNGYTPVATLPDIHGPGNEGIVFMRKILR